MKNTDKITLTIGQIKKLVKESYGEKSRLEKCFENLEREEKLAKWYIDEINQMRNNPNKDNIRYEQYVKYLITTADYVEYWAKQFHQEAEKLQN